MLRRLWGVVVALGILSLNGCGGRAAPGSPLQPRDASAFLRQQLADLPALPCPSGVSSQLWRQLKEALGSSLRARLTGAAKQTLQAPATNAAQVLLSYDLDHQQFFWYYNCPGDYDQNGEVNISDLTPLAAHFGASVPSFGGFESALSVVDGDHNNLINIADITPIGANFGTRLTGFNLYDSPNPADWPTSNTAASTIAAAASATLAAALGNRASERLQFRVDYAPLTAGHFGWLRPVDSTDGTEGTMSTLILPGADIECGLEASPVSTGPGHEITFTAHGIPDSSFYSYSWDLDDDGNFESSGALNTEQYTYNAAGLHTATVRASNGGMFRAFSVVVNTEPGLKWLKFAMTPAQFPDIQPTAISCSSFDGNPYAVVAYHVNGTSNDYLMGLIGNNTTGSNWRQHEVFISSTFAASYSGIETFRDSGLPAAMCSYNGGAIDNLEFQRAGDPFPTGLWTAQSQAATTSDPIQWYSAHMVGSRPAVAYYDLTANMLKFEIANDDVGGTWGSYSLPLGATLNAGMSVSMLDMGGTPALAYYDANSPNALKFVSSTGSLPFTWSSPTVISNDACVMFDSLLKSPFYLQVAYHDVDTQSIYWHHSSDPTGSSWLAAGRTLVASTSGDPNIVPQAILTQTFYPHVFWVDTATGNLMHSSTYDFSGSTGWSAPETVATSIDTGVRISPFELNGYPAVGYATGNHQFKLAVKY